MSMQDQPVLNSTDGRQSMRRNVDHRFVPMANPREPLGIRDWFSKSALRHRLMFLRLKIKGLLAIEALAVSITVIFSPVSAIASEANIIPYKNGLNYFKGSEAGPISLITDFYEDNYTQIYSRAIRFYYKSNYDNTLHEIKSFVNNMDNSSEITIYNSFAPDCVFSLTRLVRNKDNLILVFFKREFNIVQSQPAIQDISLFRLTKEETPLDYSLYFFKKYKNLISKKPMCTPDEMDDYLQSNLNKLIN